MAAIVVGGYDLESWCRRELGSGPVELLFETVRRARVTGLRLADGRAVVIKVREPAARLAACVQVQRRLWESGFPCPEPLTAPTPLDGRAAHAERLLAGGGPLGPDHDGVRDHAALLADLLRRTPPVSAVPPLAPAPPWVGWDHDGDGVWPPDDRDDDLNACSRAGWLDDVAGLVRDRLRALAGVPVLIGHGGWETRNIRWRGGRPWAVYDWDSLFSAPEAVVVGLAAAVWPAGAATVAQSRAFVTSYQDAAGRRWSEDEVEASWAAGLWARAFHAKRAALVGQLDVLDRAEARVRLRRAGL